MRNIGQVIGVALEIMGVGFLAGMGVKAECDRHKAEMKLRRTELELMVEQTHNVVLKAEIRHLEKQLEKQKEGEA